MDPTLGTILVGAMVLAGVLVNAYTTLGQRRTATLLQASMIANEKAALAARDTAVDAREAAVLAKETALATAEVGRAVAKQVAEIATNVDGNLTRSTEQAKELGLLLGRFQASEVARAEQTQRDAITAATLAGAQAVRIEQAQTVPPGFVVTQAPAPTPPVAPAAPMPVEVTNTQPVPVDVVVHVDHDGNAEKAKEPT